VFFYDAKRHADQQSLSPRSATSPAAASVVVEASFSGAAEGDGDDTVSTLAEANSVLVAEKSALEKTVLRMVAEKSSLEETHTAEKAALEEARATEKAALEENFRQAAESHTEQLAAKEAEHLDALRTATAVAVAEAVSKAVDRAHILSTQELNEAREAAAAELAEEKRSRTEEVSGLQREKEVTNSTTPPSSSRRLCHLRLHDRISFQFTHGLILHILTNAKLCSKIATNDV